jgi:hypothetical protein
MGKLFLRLLSIFGPMCEKRRRKKSLYGFLANCFIITCKESDHILKIFLLSVFSRQDSNETIISMLNLYHRYINYIAFSSKTNV